MGERISFHEQIARNKRKSFFLVFIVILVIIALAYVIGMIYGDPFLFLIIGTIIAIVYSLIGYYGSSKLALASVNAKEADKQRYRQYYNIVEGLTLASGMPMPKLYVMENSQINAFASGRNPKNSVICVTTGALEKLDKHELEGVLSHELSHIANYDIRFMTLTAILVGMVAIISEIFLRSLWFRSNDRNNRASIIFLIIGILLAILAPIFVQLVQLAISRKREYAADASAVKFTRTPTGLIGALRKIKGEHIDVKQAKHHISKAIAPLFISNPFKNADITSTHPSLDKRIEILSKM